MKRISAYLMVTKFTQRFVFILMTIVVSVLVVVLLLPNTLQAAPERSDDNFPKIVDTATAGIMSNFCVTRPANEAAQGNWMSPSGQRTQSGSVIADYGTTSVSMWLNSAVHICDTGMTGGVVNTSRTATTFGVVSQSIISGGENATIAGLDTGGNSTFVSYNRGTPYRWSVNENDFSVNFSVPLTETRFLAIQTVSKAINHRLNGAFECVTNPGTTNVRIPVSSTDFAACNSVAISKYPLIVYIKSTYKHTTDLSVSNKEATGADSAGCQYVKLGATFRLRSKVKNTGGTAGPAYDHQITTTRSSYLSGGTLQYNESSNLAYSSSNYAGVKSGASVVWAAGWGNPNTPSLSPNQTSTTKEARYTLKSTTPFGTKIYFVAAMGPAKPWPSGDPVPRAYSKLICITPEIPPSLPCVAISPVFVWVGQPITASVNVTNSSSSAVDVTKVTAQLQGSSTKYSAGSGSISANGGIKKFTRNNMPAYSSEGVKTITWRITTAGGTESCPGKIIVLEILGCSAVEDVISWAGNPFTARVKVTNPNNTQITIPKLTFQLEGQSAKNVNVSKKIPPLGSEVYSANATASNAPGVYNITWKIITPGNDKSCPGKLTVYALPTCRVEGTVDPLRFRAGDKQNMSRAYLTNTRPNVAFQPKYKYNASSANGAIINGNGNGAEPVSLTNETEYIEDNGAKIMKPGNYTVTWTIGSTSSDTGYVAPSITCKKGVEIYVEPLVCTIPGVYSEINTSFKIKLQLTNNNLIPIPISKTQWSAPGLSPNNGFGKSITTAGSVNSNGGGWSLPVTGSTVSSGSVKASNTGTYNVAWDVDTVYAAANPVNCAAADVVEITRSPYVRFYGNDVFAGGGYGETCASGAKFARAKGVFGSSTKKHSTYKGSASELAVFATGQITGILPGSQKLSRSPIDELSFANFNNGSYNTSTSNLQFGGGFGGQLCAPDIPDTAGFSTIGTSNLGSLDGEYRKTSNLKINGSTIGNGQRIKIVVAGNITIGGNIKYTSTSWATMDDIPLVQIYATGNIYIREGVTRLDGLYSAGGTIHTCAKNFSAYNPNKAGDGDDAAILDRCGNKLTVNGAFVAQRVNLLRHNGTISTSVPGEKSNGASVLAEVFVFSPEMYLSLLAEGMRNNTSSKYDSILSLPPAF